MGELPSRSGAALAWQGQANREHSVAMAGVVLDWGARRVEIRPARLEDTELVRGALEHASAWLRARGIDQWPERFSLDWVGPAVEHGDTWLAECNGQVAGTLTISSADPVWPEDQGDARYVHRVAVERWAAGLGRVLVDWAGTRSVSEGCRFLRLDCVDHNEQLCHYYDALNFEERGKVDLHGTVVRRYERRLVDY